MTSSTECWTSGSYGEVARNYLSIAGHLVSRTNVSGADAVLDIGCGTGNVAITAARKGADVTGIDITPELLDQARENADLAGTVGIEWRTGDASELPFPPDTFDVTLSCLGHMYARPPTDSARELIRVTREGGRIGVVSWIPTDLFPFMAGVLSTYLPSDAMPQYSEPPFMWGDSDVVKRRLGDEVSTLDFETGTALYPALSPEHFWDEISEKSGTVVELLHHVAPAERSAIKKEMIRTIRPYFNDERARLELEYLLSTATV